MPTLADDVRAIIALDEAPVVRNLRITQAYHDLSDGLAHTLGKTHINWCTIATWASKTAGQTIRQEEVPAWFQRFLHHEDASGHHLPRIYVEGDDVVISERFYHKGLLRIPKDILDAVSLEIIAGNLKVFAELAPLFAGLIAVFDGSPETQKADFDALIAPLRPGRTDEGGQDLLRQALTHFYEAAHEEDAKRKAELVLLANSETGLHEQIRLQQYIEGALNAPIRQAFQDALYDLCTAFLPESWGKRLFKVLRWVISPVIWLLEHLWRFLATKTMMKLALPDGKLSLGHDLKPLRHHRLFGGYLQLVENPRLLQVLDHYEAKHTSEAARTGASDWASLYQRMHFILVLFRSRQDDKELFNQPFAEAQRKQVYANERPAGSL